MTRGEMAGLATALQTKQSLFTTQIATAARSAQRTQQLVVRPTCSAEKKSVAAASSAAVLSAIALPLPARAIEAETVKAALDQVEKNLFSSSLSTLVARISVAVPVSRSSLALFRED